MDRNDPDGARRDLRLDQPPGRCERRRRCRTNTTRPPAWVIVSVVEIQECAVVITSSPGLTPEPPHGDVEGVGAVGAGDAVFDAEQVRPALSKASPAAPDIGRFADDVRDGRVNLGLDGQVLGVEINEGDPSGFMRSWFGQGRSRRAGLPRKHPVR